MTCYNYERFVEEAVRSVSAQTYTNLECVIIDDCSQDNSFAAITRLLDELSLPHFRAIRLGENSGQMLAFRAGLENSDGRFVVFLDADDVLEPTFVAMHIAAHLNSSKSAAMTASDTITIDDSGNVLEGTFFQFGADEMPQVAPLVDIPPLSLSEEVVSRLTCQGLNPNVRLKFRVPSRWGWPFSATSSFMFRRDVLKLMISQVTDSIRICADWYLVQMSCALSGAILIYDRLGRYRHHASNNFVGDYVIGGWRRPALAKYGDLLDTISRMADEVVTRDYSKFRAVAPDRFFDFFPDPRSLSQRKLGQSRLKRSLEVVWSKLPRRVQASIMPLADWIDRTIK